MNKEDIKLYEAVYLATTRCNCRCKHCAANLHTGKENELSSKKLIERYEESELLKRNSIAVAGGEPFIKEDIEEFICYLDKKKIPCVITTNGWFTEKIESLLNHLENTDTIRFSISIDGVGEVHDKIRGVRGCYDRALKSVKLIKSRNFEVQVNMVAQKDNYMSISEMKKVFGELGVPLNVIPKFKVDNEEFEFNEEQIKKVYPDIYLPREKKLLLSKGEYIIQNNCHAGKNTWLLDSNGDIYTCNGGFCSVNKEKYIIGNLRDTSFDDIFFSERAQFVFENVVSNCKGCANCCDMEREVTEFGYSTELNVEEASILKEYINNKCTMEDISCDNFNWNELECDNIGKYKWMKRKKASVFVKVPLDYSRLSIKFFNFCDTNELGEKVWIDCYVNGKELGKQECVLGEQEYCIKIDDLNLPVDELVQVSICSNLLWTPRDRGMGEDKRSLGLAIREITIGD